MKIALYCRISTSNGRQDLTNQLAPLREWATRLGGEISQEYIDEASGSRSNREALSQLLDDVHERRFDTILIWSLDRLTREGISQTVNYLGRFKQAGVRLRSLQESWVDTESPTSELLLAVFAWIAKQERTRVRERVLAGLGRARREGRRLGRPPRHVDLSQAFKLRSEGRSVREIAQILRVPRSTLARAFSVRPQAKAA